MSASLAPPSSTIAFCADCSCPKMKCKLHGRCVECRSRSPKIFSGYYKDCLCLMHGHFALRRRLLASKKTEAGST